MRPARPARSRQPRTGKLGTLAEVSPLTWDRTSGKQPLAPQQQELVLGARRRRRDSAAKRAYSEAMALTTIIAGCDLSQHSDNALERAIGIALLHRAKVV